MDGSDLDARVTALLAEGELDQAVSLTIRRLGPDILGFLHAVAREEAMASDAFSLFCEDVWRGLRTFERRSSLSSWCYVVARRALYRTTRRDRRRREVHTEAVADIAEKVKTETLPYLRTAAKEGIRALRDEMDEDDRVLITLRIDRRMAWRDLALVFLQRDGETDDTLADGEITRTAATLRKRFERVKARLKKLAAERGLLARE